MKILHNILKGVSLTGALFVFQACYGVPQPLIHESGEAPMSFTLLSKDTGQPLKGIQIYGRVWNSTQNPQTPGLLGETDASGKCRVSIPYVMDVEGPYLRFEDPGNVYSVKDTLITDLRERDIVIKLNPKH